MEKVLVIKNLMQLGEGKSFCLIESHQTFFWLHAPILITFFCAALLLDTDPPDVLKGGKTQ
jgi:hypothetical protein